MKASEFLRALGGEDNEYCFQWIREDGQAKYGGHIYGSLHKCLPTLQKHNDEGCGIFVTINETDGHGRLYANIRSVRALFVDKDNGVFRSPNRVCH